MACFYPLRAWRLDSGDLVFREVPKHVGTLQLPCGQCVGCRLERSRQWAVRVMHESQMHDSSCFISLTYDKLDSLSLRYRDFQLFMKRLRKAKGKVRFYMCGEYGGKFGRPHFHACLFGCFFEDRQFFKTTDSGAKLYISKELEKLWPYGFSSVGDVTFESAAYVARYVMKKVTGSGAEGHYQVLDTSTGELVDREPEFNSMSLKPGIGATWYEKYKNEVFPRDYVVVNGVKARPPRYYDKMFQADIEGTDVPADIAFELEDLIEHARLTRAMNVAYDNTPDRLAVRETCTIARLKFKKRVLE